MFCYTEIYTTRDTLSSGALALLSKERGHPSS
uniref:Uncharacterized protein n=1 Tax=Anguilla anguilla TaxID=7936 RepID=A0A0E9T3S8_ANGAN